MAIGREAGLGVGQGEADVRQGRGNGRVVHGCVWVDAATGRRGW